MCKKWYLKTKGKALNIVLRKLENERETKSRSDKMRVKWVVKPQNRRSPIWSYRRPILQMLGVELAFPLALPPLPLVHGSTPLVGHPNFQTSLWGHQASIRLLLVGGGGLVERKILLGSGLGSLCCSSSWCPSWFSFSSSSTPTPSRRRGRPYILSTSTMAAACLSVSNSQCLWLFRERTIVRWVFGSGNGGRKVGETRKVGSLTLWSAWKLTDVLISWYLLA